MNGPTDQPTIDRMTSLPRPAQSKRDRPAKFAHDLWDTVNLASRLEANGEPGRILVSRTTAGHLESHYRLGPERLIDL